MVEIPTKEEIEQLPRWARVAFAARCARRVQPLYVIAWPDAHKNHIRDIDAAITLAEEAAENAVKNAKISLAAAGNAADSAGYVGDDIDAYHAVGYTAVRAATYAAATAAFAADSANPVEDAISISNVVAAAREAVFIEITHVRRDLDLLLAKALEEKWDAKTPVPPTVFGPMWPGGEPEWLHEGKLPGAMSSEAKTAAEPLALSEVSSPQFVVVWDPDVIDEQDYADLVEAIGDLVRSEDRKSVV